MFYISMQLFDLESLPAIRNGDGNHWMLTDFDLGDLSQGQMRPSRFISGHILLIIVLLDFPCSNI